MSFSRLISILNNVKITQYHHRQVSKLHDSHDVNTLFYHFHCELCLTIELHSCEKHELNCHRFVLLCYLYLCIYTMLFLVNQHQNPFAIMCPTQHMWSAILSHLVRSKYSSIFLLYCHKLIMGVGILEKIQRTFRCYFK